MKIEDLKRSFTQMSFSEQLEVVKTIRAARLNSKKRRSQSESKKPKKRFIDVKIENTLKNLTPEQLVQLKKLMEDL